MKTTNYNPIIKLIDDYVYEIQGTRNLIKECLENPAFKIYKGKFENDLEIKLHESFFYGTPYSGGGRSPMPPQALFTSKKEEGIPGPVSELDKALKQIDTLDDSFTKDQVMNLIKAIPAAAKLASEEGKQSPIRKEANFSLAKAYNKLENIQAAYENIINQVRAAKKATRLNASSAETAINAGLTRRAEEREQRSKAEIAKKAEIERLTAQLEPEIAAYEKRIKGKKAKPEDSRSLSRADAKKALEMADAEELEKFEKGIKEPGKVIRFLKFLGLTEQVSSRKLSK